MSAITCTISNFYNVMLCYIGKLNHCDNYLDSGVSSGNATEGMEGNGAITYSVPAGGPTQYLTLGNGASLAYGDGVTPGSPKSYNDFSAVM